ncbi:MAG TPA: hypothetical protein VJB34_05590 [Bdellovibrionota bacterium]|nr:hypothetical protein [Bdellovibrionota bacterium]
MLNKVGRVAGWVVVGLFLSINLAFSYPLTPDPEMTQGDLCTKDDPDFEKYEYQEKIPYCERNVSFSRREKIYDEYKIPYDCRHRYTIDHLIPLSLGGSNADINLWPEHVLVKAQRPLLEYELYLALERGEISQKDAIDIVVNEKTKETPTTKGIKIKNTCD